MSVAGGSSKSSDGDFCLEDRGRLVPTGVHRDGDFDEHLAGAVDVEGIFGHRPHSEADVTEDADRVPVAESAVADCDGWDFGSDSGSAADSADSADSDAPGGGMNTKRNGDFRV